VEGNRDVIRFIDTDTYSGYDDRLCPRTLDIFNKINIFGI
jgi:hypothetical protein